MEIFILIGVVLVGLGGVLWFRTKKTTVVKAEEPVVPQAEVAPVVVKEEPMQKKVEEFSFTIEEITVAPEVVKPKAKKPKAKKPVAAQPAAPKPKRTRKPKA